MSGLLVNGLLVPVPGLNVIPPASHGGPTWASLGVDDYRMRPTTWVRAIVLHTTKGLWPQHEIPGSGPGGSAKVVSDFWRGDPTHSAAQLVVDTDGAVACLCDLGRIEAYHAEGSNPWSVGIEMYQLGDGGVYQATLDATVKLVSALTLSGATVSGLFPIPAQIPGGVYPGYPIARLETGAGNSRVNSGGPNVVGVYGHRDNTSRRGRGDPGDPIFDRLATAGFEKLNYQVMEDLAVGSHRQNRLNERDDAANFSGSRLTGDGVCGPASVAAMRRQGFARWRDVV